MLGTVSKKQNLLWVALACASWTSFAGAAPAENTQATTSRKDAWAERTSLEVNWRPAYRLTYIYYETTNTTSLPALFNGPGDGLSVPYWEPLRFELRANLPLGNRVSLMGRAHGGRANLRLYNTQAIQNGFDLWLDAGIAFSPDVPWATRFRAYALLRSYTWFFNESQIPRHGNLGLALGIKHGWGDFDFTFEVTTAATGILTDRRLGVQQDASQLRLLGEYSIHMTEKFALKPGLEFFHSKANFSASNSVPGHEAFFWDDVQVSVLLGASYTF
jgi:hypothetical protein